MADLYSHYDDIDEGSVSNTVSEIISELDSKKSELESFSGFVDSEWKKAQHAQTILKTAFEKIIGEVYSELETQLQNLQTVCNEIIKYKEARTNAQNEKQQAENLQAEIDSGEKKDPASKAVTLASISLHTIKKQSYEAIMKEAISTVDSYL